MTLLDDPSPGLDREFQVALRYPTAGYETPGSAATIQILDEDFGILPDSAQRREPGVFELTVRNPSCGRRIRLEASPDLRHWAPVSTNANRDCYRSVRIQDPGGAGSRTRFYRVALISE